MGDEETARVAIEMFLEDAPQQLARAEAAIRAKDAISAARELHMLKGSSATVGAEAFRARVVELERTLLDGGLALAGPLLVSAWRELERLRQALEKGGEKLS